MSFHLQTPKKNELNRQYLFKDKKFVFYTYFFRISNYKFSAGIPLASSHFLNLSCILLSSVSLFPSKRNTRHGVVFDGLTSPQQSSKSTLKPSMVLTLASGKSILIDNDSIASYCWPCFSKLILISGVLRLTGN